MIEEKEISLSAILFVMWDRGKRILAFTLVCTLLGAAATLMIKNRYESTATLFMNKSKIGERTMQNPSVPMRTYEQLFFPDEVLIEVMKRFNLDKEPYEFKYPDDFNRRIRVEYVYDTAILKISVKLEKPQMAADVANYLAQCAIDTVKDLVKLEQNTSTGMMKLQSDTILDQAMRYKEVYLEMLKKNMKPLQIQIVNNDMTLYANAVQEKETLDASIIELEEKKNKFEELIFSATSEYKQKVALRRAVVTDPLLLERIREQKGSDVNLDDLKDIVFYEEQIDVYYNQLMSEYKKLLVDLPGLIKKRDYTASRIGELKDEIKRVQSELFAMDVDELIAKGDFDREMEIYAGIYKEESWVGTTVGAERQDLVPIFNAVPDPKKVSPRRSLMVGLTGMSAFLLAFLYYLLIDLYGLVKLQTVRKDEV